MSCEVEDHAVRGGETFAQTREIVVEDAGTGVRLVSTRGREPEPTVVIGRDGKLASVESEAGRGTFNRLQVAWERTLGMWSGLTVPESTNGSAVEYGPSAVFPEAASTNWFYRFHFADRADCDGVRGGPTCVTIAYDADAFGPGVQQILDRGLAPKMAAGGAAPTWTSPKITLRGELLVEESTLIPLSRHEEHKITVSAVSPYGASEPVTMVARTDEKWSCDVSPAVAQGGRDTGTFR